MSTSTPDSPRVLFVIGGLGQGGSEHQLTELLLAQHPDRVHATVGVLSSGSTPHRDRLERHGVRVVDLGQARRRNPLRAAASVGRLLRLAVRYRPAAVYAWLEESALTAAPVAWCTGVPLVVARRNVSGSSLERCRWPLSLVVPMSERTAKVVTVNSMAGAAFAEARGIRPGRVRLVPNGHPLLPPHPAPDGDQPFVFGCVAQFRPEKGHFRLLSALARLPRDPRWTVRFAGTGTLLDEARRRATDLGLDGQVSFLGPVADVRGFWASCHAALLTSDHEGQPNAIIEAAFAGRPAIATAVGGTPEVVGPSGGILVDPADEDALVRALSSFVGDPRRVADMGAAAHRQATARFSAAASDAGHLAALHEAIG